MAAVVYDEYAKDRPGYFFGLSGPQLITGRGRRLENRLLIGQFGHDDALTDSQTLPVPIHLPGTLPQTWHLLLPRLV